jgi:hypothetical protein
MVISSNCNLTVSKPIFAKSVLVGVISGMVLASGLIPTLRIDTSNRSIQLLFSNRAYAQTVSDGEVRNYVRAAIEVEQIRRRAYDEIKRMLGYVPPIECHRLENLNNLNQDARTIARNYCDRFTHIVEDNNLTIERFNTIHITRQTDAELESRIEQEVNRVQQSQRNQ